MQRILPGYVDGFSGCSRRALRAGVTRESKITSNECNRVLLVIFDSLVTPPPAVGRRANSR
jgi:hypothetical protein